MNLNEKFQPLFTTKKRYILLTGGRGSAKSFHATTFQTLLTYERGHKILFTRYTMKSAEISIIPEFKQKIDLLKIGSDFSINKTDITNNRTGSSAIFRGIKTSEGIQTANLKSIEGITTWVLDEAEELQDESDFDTIDLSIRNDQKQNRVIMIMNPTTREHWIWKRFFEHTHKIVQIDGWDVPISTHPDVCHIHTTYLDNVDNLSESFLTIVNKLKLEDRHKYYHTMIGGWILQLEGTLFDRTQIKRFSMKDFKTEGCESKLGYIDVADEGTDALAFPVGYVFPNKVYITDVVFSTDNIDVTEPLSVSMIKKHDLDYVRVEANNQGSIFIKNLRKQIEPSKILKVTNSTKKHTRIILAYGFIKEYFYFLQDSEIEPGSPYDLFMRQIWDYMRQEGETKDKDDAPDGISGLAKFIESFLPHLFK